MEKFTKGKIVATKPKGSSGFWYLDKEIAPFHGGSIAVLYGDNAENDAKLFAVANEMYEKLKLISDLSILSEDKGLSDVVDELLERARGEHHV